MPLAAGTRVEQHHALVSPAADKAIVLDRPIERRSDLDWLVVELPDDAFNSGTWIAEDPWQRVYRDTTGRLLLRIERRQASPEPTRSHLDSAALRPYLSPSLYVHPNDSRVRAIVAQLEQHGDWDAWSMAMRIRRWVYDNMVPRDTNVRFKSSSEVMEDMEGTAVNTWCSTWRCVGPLAYRACERWLGCG